MATVSNETSAIIQTALAQRDFTISAVKKQVDAEKQLVNEVVEQSQQTAALGNASGRGQIVNITA